MLRSNEVTCPMDAESWGELNVDWTTRVETDENGVGQAPTFYILLISD